MYHSPSTLKIVQVAGKTEIFDRMSDTCEQPTAY